MEKIDRLGWAVGKSFVSYGATFGLRASDAGALPWLVSALPEAEETDREVVQRLFSIKLAPETTRPGLKVYNLLYADHVRIVRTLDRRELLDALASQVRLHVAEHARRRVFVHAGVVAFEGEAILIPGRSLAGKTTLVAELLRRGATYYSDEFAVLDERGRVHPFPKTLSMRKPGEISQEEVPPEAFGASQGTEPLPVGLVLVGRFREGRRWRPRELSPGRAILALLDNAVAARRAPARVLATLEKVVARARVLKGDRGEASETAGRVLDALRELRMHQGHD
jgi:hypothetical protein